MKRALFISQKNHEGPAYLHIAELLRSSIKNGQLRPGEKLPSLREIAERLKTHRHTVMAAFHELISEGWIESEQRKGYSVTRELPSTFFPTQKAQHSVAPSSRNYRIVRETTLEHRNAHLSDSCKYNFQSGLADLRLFPLDEFRSHLNEGLKRQKKKLLNYSSPVGHPSLLIQIEQYLRRVRGIVGRSILVTHGSQEGIFLLAQALLKPGDGVGVETLGYPPAWDAIRSTGAKLFPVEIDNKGIIPENFEKLLKKNTIRLLYTTPLHQYPTTITMPMERRMKIYEIAKKYDCLILEDDYDHEFHYRSNPLPPLAAEDPEGIVLYVSTFSKILFPSSRIGFVAVPPVLLPHLSGLKRMLSRQNGTILQEAVARWMEEGGFERHLRRMRRTYHERRDVLIDCIEKEIRKGKPLTFYVPDGGMAVWLDVGVDTEKVSELAGKKSIYVNPAYPYDFKRRPGSHLRLGFANQNPQEIRGGMELLLNQCLLA